MEFEKFTKTFKEALEKELEGTGIDLTEKDMAKPNHSYHALLASTDEQGLTIDVERAFSRYQRGSSIEELCINAKDSINDAFNRGKFLKFAKELFNDYDKAKSYLTTEIVSIERNSEYLETVPYTKISEDLAEIYRIILSSNEDSTSSAVVSDAMLKKFGITVEQLRRDALKNAMEKETPVVDGILGLLKSMGADQETIKNASSPFLVASVSGKNHGAKVLGYPGFLESTAERLDNSFWIIPSSIHEVLILPEGMPAVTPQDLQEMIKQVNDTEVDEEDILSYKLYHYDMGSQLLETADTYRNRTVSECI
jgi:beta-glucosidase/6-phospho-beta-glucosidase/beta-galactosidase